MPMAAFSIGGPPRPSAVSALSATCWRRGTSLGTGHLSKGIRAMDELIQSMIRCSWAMSLFGVRQIAAVLTPRDRMGRAAGAAAAFDTVAFATETEVRSWIARSFQVGDRIQRRMVDL